MKPMMSDREIKIIDRLLTGARCCLEWGSGGSSVYFPETCPWVYWLSVEHDGNWLKKISDDLPTNSNVVWVPEDPVWYVDCVKHTRRFDFILIDGLYRERCLEIAKQIISKDGVILLHDAGRKEYQEFIKKHGGEILIEGEEPYEGHYKHRGLALFR